MALTAACADLQVTDPPPGADDSGDAASTTTTAPRTTTTARPTTTTRPPAPPTTPPTTRAVAPPVDNSPEARSLSFVNGKRGENGLTSLRTDPDLTRAAEGWAAELVRRQDLGHNPNLSDAVPDRFHAWGENVAYSSTDGNIDQMWWESEGHRANILGASYTSIGIAFVQDDSGLWWAVQVFAG